ncbi:hypothetical protein CTAYLR_007623 [Chrysophaeum taylorii]|uniref:peptidylprolyl isomerase n=1 Tax=Chrysophaeum taylorii TaxID=2483200 RepID=A0AAD7UFE8_9STRA|nr:hypothetical protein CTAYLR_007623 [Chrysophaeum taylorii]
MLRISYVQFVRVGETLEPIDEIDSFIVRHGNGRTIRGLDEGIHTMRVGGVRRVEVPPQLGYNIVGLGPLPEGPLKRRKLAKNLDKPGATVVFDVALLETWKDAADLGFYDDSTYTADQMDFILKKAKLASQGLVG